jgi:hypothetical protein
MANSTNCASNAPDARVAQHPVEQPRIEHGLGLLQADGLWLIRLAELHAAGLLLPLFLRRPLLAAPGAAKRIAEGAVGACGLLCGNRIGRETCRFGSGCQRLSRQGSEVWSRRGLP